MITGMNHITLAIQDIQKSFHFYARCSRIKTLVPMG